MFQYVQILFLTTLVAAPVFAAGNDLPRVVLERNNSHGGTERIALRCAPDVHGNQEFFCEVLRYRNGIEVATTGVYSKQTKKIIASFFKQLPRKYRRPSAGKVDTRDALVTWEVVYKGKSAKGIVPRRAKKSKPERRLARAVLSLEGSLSSLFYQ